MKHFLFVVFLSTAPGWGQTEWMSPSGGLLFDASSRSLRQILGSPGSAVLSDAVAEADRAWPAPGNTLAAVALRNGSSYLLTPSASGKWTETPLNVAADLVAWNQTGTTAAVYSAADGVVQRIRISRDREAQIDSPLSLTLNSKVAALAVNSAGAIALGCESAVLLLASDGSPSEVLTQGSQALAFSDDDTLLAATVDAVLAVRTGTQPDVRTFADEPGVRLLNVYSPARRVVTISGDDNTITVRDSAGSKLMQLNAERAPTRLDLLKSGNFLLDGLPAAGSPALVLDLSGTPRVLFIPPAVQGAE